MGGKSRSRTESHNHTETHNRNDPNNAVLSGDVEAGAIALSGRDIELTQVDPGALDFARHLTTEVGGLVNRVLDSNMQVYSAADDLVGKAVDDLAASKGVESVTFKEKRDTKILIGVGVAFSLLTLFGYLKGRR